LFDVLIVGAGTAGSYVAYRLAAQGYKVAVIEKQQEIGKRSCCTGIVGRDCVDSFPIDRELILNPAYSARFFSPSGRALRIWKETAQAYVLNRPALDLALAAKAQREGADFLLGSRARKVVLDRDYVSIEVEEGEKRFHLRGKAAVLASGFGSQLPQMLGLGEIKDFVLGVQTEVETNGIEEVEVYLGQELAPGFFAWLVPTSPGKALAGLLARHAPAACLRNFLSFLVSEGKIALPQEEFCYGAVPLKPLPRTFQERVIVVGDAAGQVKPTTGGGIYYGLLCAEVGSTVLGQALQQGDFSPAFLARYEREWRKKLAAELRVCYYARRVYEKLGDQQIEDIFHLIQSNSIHEALLKSEGFSFDWHANLILKALKHQVVQKALQMINVFRLSPQSGSGE
jgi:geranylgeranyl reductase family protein